MDNNLHDVFTRGMKTGIGQVDKVKLRSVQPPGYDRYKYGVLAHDGYMPISLIIGHDS